MRREGGGEREIVKGGVRREEGGEREMVKGGDGGREREGGRKAGGETVEAGKKEGDA